MVQGYDGFEALMESEFVVDGEQGILISTLMRQFFIGLKSVNALRYQKRQRNGEELARHAAEHWKQLVVGRRNGTREAMSGCKLRKTETLSAFQGIDESLLLDWATIEPVVEGRIVAIE
jgi:hypothetical protein